MERVLTAELAELFELESIGVIFLVLDRVVVSLFALGTNQCDLCSHFSAPPICYLPLPDKEGTKTKPSQR